MRNQDLFVEHKLTKQQQKQQSMISAIQAQVFDDIKTPYEVKNIHIGEDEDLHTIFIPTTAENLEYTENFFIGHGFGASSLMYFPVLSHLLTKGNVILCELRGMGLNLKPKSVTFETNQAIEQYFLRGYIAILKYYKVANATFICHSFSAYLILLLTLRYPKVVEEHVKQLLMLSPVGLTPKEEDYKNQIRGCGDFIHLLMHKIGWCFKLTYKSPVRTICSCCKTRLIMNSLNEENLNPKEKVLICRIIETLIALPDGSEHLFYQLFEPRVLPKMALEPLIKEQPKLPIVLVFGGELDWVDRTGAKRLSERFPQKIKIVEIPGITHNIGLHTVQCHQLFQQLFR